MGETAKQAVPTIWQWLLPLLAVAAALALLLWFIFGRTPRVADFTQVSTDLTGTIKSLTDSLTGIRDAATAEAALPKLTELAGKLGGMKAVVDKLPAADQIKVTDLIKGSVGKLEDQFANLLWIPGVGDKFKSTVDGVMGQLTALGGLPASKVSQLSSEVAGTFSSLTTSLSNIKDKATAEAALPKLKDIGDKLAAEKTALEGLSESGKSTILGLVRPALTRLKELADRVLAITGVGEIIRPTVEAIMHKLNGLVA
jgi:hypothetical protein